MDIFDSAVTFAVQAHSGAMRKGTQLPYILHPMETAAIAGTMTDDPEILAAAVLHDVVEDTPTTAAEIARRFGARVSKLVAAESEDKREDRPAAETWRIRKEETVEHLMRARDNAVKMLTLSDKLSNIRAIYRDQLSMGDALWRRFNQKDKRQHAWY